MKPTKREWIDAYLNGLEANGYCGRVQITLEWNKGGISRLGVMRQDHVGDALPRFLVSAGDLPDDAIELPAGVSIKRG